MVKVIRVTSIMLRDSFKKRSGINWHNSQGEPDIDYVEFLEGRLIEISQFIEGLKS